MQSHARAHLTLDELMPDLELPQPMMRVLPTEPLQLPNPCTAVGLVLVATASVIVSVTALLVVALHSSPPGRLLTTGTRESASAQFADGTRVELGADAAVRVNITEHQRSARVIAGAFEFTVPDLATDFWLDTPVAQALISEAARFRVVISAESVEVNVYEGTLWFYEEGLSPNAPVRPVGQGQAYHKRVNTFAAAVAAPAARVNEPGMAAIEASTFSSCERSSVYGACSMHGAAPMRLNVLRRLLTGSNAISHSAL